MNSSDEVYQEGKAFLIFCASTAVSSASLMLWILLQWIVGKLIGYFRLSGFDNWWLVAFQWLFAISTFVPIASHIFKNSMLAIVRAWRSVRDELKQ